MIVNYKKKEVQIKIVYFGCAMSGKTTSLRNLFSIFGDKYKLKSIETSTGRTLFFDFGTVVLGSGEWKLKLMLYTATGQDFYATTRPSTLAGSDGIIFVIDSQKEYIQDNIQSWNELQYYFGNDLTELPVIMCLNKRDLQELISENEVIETLKLNSFSKLKFTETIASQGKGILDAFKQMLGFIIPSSNLKI